MHPGFGIAIIGLICVLATISWLRSQQAFSISSPKIVWGLVIAIALLAVIAFVPMGWIVGPAGVAGGWLVRTLLRMGAGRVASQMFAQGQPSAGNSSSVRTEWLNASLDHDTGMMGATIVQGAFAGRTLDVLSLGQLRDFADELLSANADDSMTLLETYLDHSHPGWRDEDAGQNGGNQGRSSVDHGAQMTIDQAYEVLGLTNGATRADIVAAHRRLISKVHPDRGGSSYLAAKLNQAKELLLQRL